MGSNASFFGGLVSGVGSAFLQHEQRVFDDKLRQKQNRIAILEAAVKDPNITDQARDQIWQELMTLTPGSKKNQQHGMDVMGMLLGKPSGGAPAAQPQPTSQSAPQVSDSTNAAPSVSPNPSAPTIAPNAALPQPTGAPSTGATAPQPQPTGASSTGPTAALSGPPKPPSIFKTRQQVLDEDVAKKKREFEEITKPTLAYESQLTQQRTIEANKLRWAYRGISSGGELPDGKKDVNGADFDPQRRYRVEENGMGEQRYYPIEDRRLDSQQRKFNEKVKDYIAANPNVSQQNAELAVRKDQYKTNQLRVIGLGLRNEATKARVSQIQKEMEDGQLSYEGANALWNGAFRAAHARKSQDLDAFDKSIDQLADEELKNVGTSREEVAAALRPGRKGKGGTKPAAKKPAASASSGPKTAADYLAQQQ